MTIWAAAEDFAWRLSLFFGLSIVVDWVRTDATYSDEDLMSSR